MFHMQANRCVLAPICVIVLAAVHWHMYESVCVCAAVGLRERGRVVSQRGKSYFYKLQCGRKEKIRAAS